MTQGSKGEEETVNLDRDGVNENEAQSDGQRKTGTDLIRKGIRRALQEDREKRQEL